MVDKTFEEAYKNKNVLITGGCGFVGSNLAMKLVESGANVTLVDAMLPLYGGNLFNIQSIQEKVKVNFADIRDISAMNYLVRDQDYVFHVAGQVSHVDSILDPFEDLSINCQGTLAVVEACRKYNPGTKVIFTGTRGQYGANVELPVNEKAPTNPMGMYAITNLTAEKIVLMYNDVHDVRGVSLRITNTYGPRHQMKHNRYGVLNWFVRKAIDNEPIDIFGDGKILRDFLYIDDTINAILMVGISEEANGQVFNVGSEKPISFLDLANKIIEIAGSGSTRFTAFTKERKALEPGDFYADITKIKTKIGWEPKVELEDGLEQTIDFYRRFKENYWE